MLDCPKISAYGAKSVYYLIKKCFVVLCSLILFIGLYSSEIHADTPEQTEQYRYALGLIQRKLYDEAAKVLTRLTSDPEQFSLMDAAVFWLAECEYRKGDYVKAAGYYKKLIKEFPGSEYYDRSAYGLGWSHTKDNNPKSAVEAFLSVTKKEIPLWTDAKLKAGYLMVKYSMDTEKMIENYEDLLKENSLKPLQLYESNLQIAVGRFNQAIYKKALEFFNSALKHAPKDKIQAVQFYIAECQFRLKEYKLAASDYSKTMAIDPNSVLGQKSAYSLAWCNINNGESDKAISLFKNQVLETESVVRKESLKNLIELFMNTHDYQSAVEWADKYAQILDVKDKAEVDYTKALALSRIGEFQKSLVAFSDYLKKYPKNEKINEVHYQIGLLKIALSQFKEAIIDFEKIIGEKVEASLREKALYRIGECWFNLGNITQAGDSFNRVIKLFPSGKARFDALYQIGELAYLDKNYNDAIVAFEAIGVSENELAPQAIFRAGEVFMKAGKYTDSNAKFKKYLEIEPNGKMREDAYFKIGLNWLELKDDANALTAFSELLNAKGYFRQEARFNIAEIAARLGNHPLAIQHYKAIVAEDPKHPLASQARRAVGVSLYKLEDFENAIAVFTSVIKDYPAGDIAIPESRLWLGKSLIKANKIEAGILEILKVPVLYPNNPNVAEAYASAARGYKLINQNDKMKMMYEEVLKHKPEKDLKAEAEKQLNRKN